MSDMWQPQGEDPRDYSVTRGEQQTVLTYLRNYRHTFRLKCEALDAEQMARRSVPPSTLSLLGLVRHLAQMEHHWSVRVLQGGDEPQLYKVPEDRERDFTGATADPGVVEEAWATFNRVASEADDWYDRDTDWDRLIDGGDAWYEVRDIMVHVVEEYARHCGHADMLRECIDGRTGQ
jgi:uncharacterized damage-inducible protein DinB